MERTFTGSAPRGAVKPVDRLIRFERGVPVEVDETEAAVLDESPEWNPDADDLAGLDKGALLTIAEAEGLDVNKRLGVDRLADEIRDLRTTNADPSANTEEP